MTTLLYVVYVVGIFMGPLAGKFSNRFGNGNTLLGGVIVIGTSLAFFLAPSLPAVIGGLLSACAGFFAVHAAAVGTAGGPPTMYDNINRIREDYQRSLADYQVDRTRALSTLTTASFFGGLGLATKAALDYTGGGTVTETEVGDDGSTYGVEVRLDDGRQVEVNLDHNFNVIGKEADDDGPNDQDGQGDD